MPLYKVRDPLHNECIVLKAISPSKAACRAFHSFRRKYLVTLPYVLDVFTEGKKLVSKYNIDVIAIENPNSHELLHGIHTKTIATRIHNDTSKVELQALEASPGALVV